MFKWFRKKGVKEGFKIRVQFFIGGVQYSAIRVLDAGTTLEQAQGLMDKIIHQVRYDTVLDIGGSQDFLSMDRLYIPGLTESTVLVDLIRVG